jgi:hypothetical protein
VNSSPSNLKKAWKNGFAEDVSTAEEVYSSLNSYNPRGSLPDNLVGITKHQDYLQNTDAVVTLRTSESRDCQRQGSP